MSNWISVKDRLPEVGLTVLIWQFDVKYGDEFYLVELDKASGKWVTTQFENHWFDLKGSYWQSLDIPKVANKIAERPKPITTSAI